MATHQRPRPQPDQMTASSLYTIATRHCPAEPPTGADRDARLAELRERADGQTDLVIQIAGIILGTRVEDEYDPRHKGFTAAAAMLLEVAGLCEDDERVQQWIAVGRERRERHRSRPEPDRGW